MRVEIFPSMSLVVSTNRVAFNPLGRIFYIKIFIFFRSFFSEGYKFELLPHAYAVEHSRKKKAIY